jgi:hypothetical protein
MGIATNRVQERVDCSLGQGSHAQVEFEHNQSVMDAGVLFLLPALLSQGLLKFKELYQVSFKKYYSLESIILTFAFMALLRIKNPEQLKQCKPGELGRIMGLDRVPEVRCLRQRLQLLTDQQQASALNILLIDQWYGNAPEDGQFLYIDGHNRVYFGHKANLPVKYISRQKLCLSATTEYWVNDATGMPVMMVIGELTEKLQQAIEEYIIPQLQKTCLLREPSDDKTPRCTFVFDREAYEPAFFIRLWEKYRIAIITYRKNVKDIWDKSLFYNTSVQVLENNVTMQLCEMGTELGGYWFREVRRHSDDGHQTAIITTHPTLEVPIIAGRMFGRWCQENFFRYLIYDYDFDKIVSFGVEAIDPQTEVVNPEYRKVNHELKKLREKIGRLEAKFYSLLQQAMDEDLDKLPDITNKQAEYIQLLEKYRVEEKLILGRRAQYPARIKIGQMPEQKKYNKLKTESKLIMNIIKMICYRAETSVANLIADVFSRSRQEKHMFIKQVMKTPADIVPDYSNNTLTIILHSLSANRYNEVASYLAKVLSETETIYPGTNLRMIFKTTANTVC